MSDDLGYTTRCHNGRFKSGKRKGHCRPAPKAGRGKHCSKPKHRKVRGVVTGTFGTF